MGDIVNDTNEPFSSGEWVGYYAYESKPAVLCPMHLTLNFAEGRIYGAGIDNPGRFAIEGSYDADRRATWLKTYIGKHSVKYEGTHRDGEIDGAWTMTHIPEGRAVPPRGEFRIWPLPEGLYSDDEPLQSVLEKEVRRKTAR